MGVPEHWAEPCRACGASGVIHTDRPGATSPRPCPRCYGAGRLGFIPAPSRGAEERAEGWNIAVWDDGTIAGVYPVSGPQPAPRSDMRIVEVVPRSRAEAAERECDRVERDLDHEAQSHQKTHERWIAERARAEAAQQERDRLRDALIQMDEAVCHGNPETAKRIAREAIDARE